MHNNEKMVKRRLKMKKTAFIIVNKIEKIYNPCFSTCKKCIGSGNNENHNCTQCLSNYTLYNNNCEIIVPDTTILSDEYYSTKINT